MNKILLAVMALLVATQLIDFAFYGGNGYDLLGAGGFGLQMGGIVLDARARKAAVPQPHSRRWVNIISVGGIAMVLLCFLLKWQLLG